MNMKLAVGFLLITQMPHQLIAANPLESQINTLNSYLSSRKFRSHSFDEIGTWKKIPELPDNIKECDTDLLCLYTEAAVINKLDKLTTAILDTFPTNDTILGFYDIKLKKGDIVTKIKIKSYEPFYILRLVCEELSLDPDNKQLETISQKTVEKFSEFVSKNPRQYIMCSTIEQLIKYKFDFHKIDDIQRRCIIINALYSLDKKFINLAIDNINIKKITDDVKEKNMLIEKVSSLNLSNEDKIIKYLIEKQVMSDKNDNE